MSILQQLEKTAEPNWSYKKRLGAFYTPDELSMPLCEWAIQADNQTVLEPSFGGCGFLRSASTRIKALSSTNVPSNLFGCDIDPHAFVHLSNTVGSLVDLSHFKECDFLKFQGNRDWPEYFDVVLGNPPYIPYQNIDLESREAALSQLHAAGYELDLRSSSWGYFVLLSLLHLAKGGRIAWVLPGSFIQAKRNPQLAHLRRNLYGARLMTVGYLMPSSP